MHIRLLGTPGIIGPDGAPCPVRGLQSWAVLARVLLTERPVSRRQIAAELFPETVDPLGALRWCLASLRRALGPQAMTGDPIEANLPPDATVDALCLDDPAFEVLDAGELLEDSSPEACGPEFETWLLIERARITARIDARLRRDTLDALSTGAAERALRLARHAVRRQPLDEGAHVHLIRALILSGNAEAARAHADKVHATFVAELGEPPSDALRSAARAVLDAPSHGIGPSAMIGALLQAGRAALNVGAIDAGIDCLRRAAVAAERADDDGLRAETLAELGSALIHSVRSQDDEGIVHLRRAQELAQRSQNRSVACQAVLELCYAEALAGRRPDSKAMSERAVELAAGDPQHLATAHAFAGFNLADWGRHVEADTAYDIALSAARASGAKRREGWALGLGAWGKMRSGRFAQALDWARASAEISADLDWLSFRPWPETVIAEAELAAGQDPARIFRQLEPTLAMACELGDPCWEAAACRVLALSQERSGDLRQALQWLDRAGRAFASISDPYAALQVQILYDKTRITLAHAPAEGRLLIPSLLSTAARLHADATLEDALALRASAFHA